MTLCIFVSLVLFVLKIQLCRPLQTSSVIQSTTRKSRSFLQMEIPPYKKPRRQNVPGNLYVDESCIDCDVCRWMCPTIYGRKGVKSAVIKQPSTTEDKLHAYAAMIACPVGSIRTVVADPVVKDALNAFPAEVYIYIYIYVIKYDFNFDNIICCYSINYNREDRPGKHSRSIPSRIPLCRVIWCDSLSYSKIGGKCNDRQSSVQRATGQVY